MVSGSSFFTQIVFQVVFGPVCVAVSVGVNRLFVVLCSVRNNVSKFFCEDMFYCFLCLGVGFMTSVIVSCVFLDFVCARARVRVWVCVYVCVCVHYSV